MKKFILAKGIKLHEITCNVCKTTYEVDPKDIHDTEAQEFVSLSWEAGYGASRKTIFRDGHRYELDICQHCLSDLLGKYITDRGFMGNTTSEQAQYELLGPDESGKIREEKDTN